MTTRKEQLRRVQLNLCVECGINPQLENGTYLIYPTCCRDCAKKLILKKQLKESGLIPLYKEAIKYNTSEEFLNAVWNRLNIEKKELPLKISVGEYNLRICKLTDNLDKWGYANFGWFEGFTIFYDLVKELKENLK